MSTENTNISTDTTEQENDRPALIKKIGKTTYRGCISISAPQAPKP